MTGLGKNLLAGAAGLTLALAALATGPHFYTGPAIMHGAGRTIPAMAVRPFGDPTGDGAPALQQAPARRTAGPPGAPAAVGVWYDPRAEERVAVQQEDPYDGPATAPVASSGTRVGPAPVPVAQQPPRDAPQGLAAALVIDTNGGPGRDQADPIDEREPDAQKGPVALQPANDVGSSTPAVPITPTANS